MGRITTIALMGLMLGMTGASCAPETVSYLAEDHCANQNGDAWCLDRYADGSRPFCRRGTCGPTEGRDGCVEQRPATDECYSPCGGQQSLPDDASCIDPGGSTGSSGTTTESPADTETETEGTTTTGPSCEVDADCPSAAAPFCEPISGECVDCEAIGDPGACASADPSLPVCLEGACVQCTVAAPEACDGDTPICDDTSNTCVGCTQHADCGEAACNLYTGACLPADAVVHVGPGQEFTTIASAVASFDASTEGTLIIHQADYLEAVTVDESRVLAFLKAEGDQPTWDTPGASTAPQLAVTDATVFLEEQVLAGNGSSSSPAVLVDGGRAWIDRSRIVDNTGGAIIAQNAAELTVRNGFIGGDVSDRDAVSVVGSTATLLYSTIGAGFGMASAVACDAGATVEIRNAILVARTGDPELQCNGATVDYSATESDLGGTNTEVGPVDLAWFVDYPGGDFHLGLVPAVLVNAGQWQQGDPAVDIDGDLRPQADGSPDVPGADVP